MNANKLVWSIKGTIERQMEHARGVFADAKSVETFQDAGLAGDGVVVIFADTSFEISVEETG